MTKGGSGKSKVLGRLIFGDKRKLHGSPSRQRSSTRNVANAYDSIPPTNNVNNHTDSNQINLQDWAVWRMQLNEQMGAVSSDRRSDLKNIRRFLQSSTFYQQYCRGSSNSQCNGFQLFFSIPRANVHPELMEETQVEIAKVHDNIEMNNAMIYEARKIRSHSDDRTTTSVNSISAIRPKLIEKTISQLLPKTSTENPTGFYRTNESSVMYNGIHPRRSIRSSFMNTDRINGTWQKAVRDGNVLEKIKAFEMQAAAAQAESLGKPIGITHRIQPIISTVQSNTYLRSSPAIVHSTPHIPSTTAIQNQRQASIRASRNRYVQPVHQIQLDTNISFTLERKPHKGIHVLEPVHGDIILKRRTPTPKPQNEDDNSMTAITSIPLTTSQDHHRNRTPHNHRTNASRSRHRQEAVYDKRVPSKLEHATYKHQHKTKDTVITSGKSSSTRRRWLKGRKETPSEMPAQGDKQKTSTNKSNRANTIKAKDSTSHPKKTSTVTKKEKVTVDSSRVYGVTSTNTNESTKNVAQPSSNTIEEKQETDAVNNVQIKQDPIKSAHESEAIVPLTIQRHVSKVNHQNQISNVQEEVLNKTDDENRFSVPANNDTIVHSIPYNDNDEDEQNKNEEAENNDSDDDVFIEETPEQAKPNIARHQSFVNIPQTEVSRSQQRPSFAIRRHASQCSSNEIALDRRCSQPKPSSQIPPTNTIKKKQASSTKLNRKNYSTHDDTEDHEEVRIGETQVSNTRTLKKKRADHLLNTNGTQNSNKGANSSNQNSKQMSKQILHAIMNSMNNNQEQAIVGPSIQVSSTINDEFFENGPLTNPEETLANIATLVSK